MLMDSSANSKRILAIDCQTAGASGDMFLGALLDLGADAKRVIDAVKLLEDAAAGYKNVEVVIKQVMRREFRATKVDVSAEAVAKKKGYELVETVEKLAQKTGLSQKAADFASRTICTLVGAEAEVHGNSLADAHLHEVGLVDTPAEILGCAIALQDLGLFDARIYSTPVSVGGGLLKFSHGIVPSPAPATLAILQSKNFPIKGGPIENELTTPTGAAILVNIVDEVRRFYPTIVPLRVGYGAGNKDFQEMPNVLRITVGRALEEAVLKDEITVLETNLDDVTGEIVGHTVDRLLEEGAKDVSVTPMFTKKNRPGQIIKVIADPKDVAHLSNVLMQETGTLGVREYACERHIVSRDVVTIEVVIDGLKQNVRVKVAKSIDGEVLRIKPEFEDVKSLACKLKKPLREVLELVMASLKEALLSR